MDTSIVYWWTPPLSTGGHIHCLLVDTFIVHQRTHPLSTGGQVHCPLVEMSNVHWWTQPLSTGGQSHCLLSTRPKITWNCTAQVIKKLQCPQNSLSTRNTLVLLHLNVLFNYISSFIIHWPKSDKVVVRESYFFD